MRGSRLSFGIFQRYGFNVYCLNSCTNKPHLLRIEYAHHIHTISIYSITQSGGTTMKELFKCLRLSKFVINKFHGLSQPQLQSMISTHQYNVLITSGPAHIVQSLLSEEYPGRVFGLFRHPVERLISKFYYLQVA